jgi:hypothetical protein
VGLLVAHLEMEVVLGSEVAARTGVGVGTRFAGSHGVTGQGEEHGAAPYDVVGVLGPRKVFLWIIPERTGHPIQGIRKPQPMFAVNEQEENHAYSRSP